MDFLDRLIYLFSWGRTRRIYEYCLFEKIRNRQIEIPEVHTPHPKTMIDRRIFYAKGLKKVNAEWQSKSISLNSIPCGGLMLPILNGENRKITIKYIKKKHYNS